MAAALAIYAGDRKVINVTVTRNGAAEPLTDKTLLFAVKPSVTSSDDDNVIEKAVTEHTDPANGKTQIVLTPDDTAVAAGSYVYGIRVVDGENPTTYVVGKCVIKAPVPLGASFS